MAKSKAKKTRQPAAKAKTKAKQTAPPVAPADVRAESVADVVGSQAAYDACLDAAKALAVAEVKPFRADASLAYHNVDTGVSALLGARTALEARISRLFALCLSRPVEPEELSMLVHFYENQRDRLVKKELDAARIAGQGGDLAIDIAAWTILSRAILNLDETVTKG